MSLLDKASLIVTPNSYKTSKLYSVIPNTTLGDMDVVRATTATRVNASGLIESVGLNIPRIDYTNGSCPSLLVELQKTNLILRSEELDNAIWTKSGVTITANAFNSPSGILTADLVTPTVSDASLRQSFLSAGAIQYNFSIYLRSATGSSFSTTLRCWRDSPFTNITNSVITVTTEWQRFNFSFTALDATTHTIAIGASSTLSTGENFYAWGAQVEQGSYPTSYIPTVASTVTRNADVISKTGISSLIGQTEGTMFLDFELLPNNINSSYVFSLNDGTATNMIRSEIYILSPTVSQFRTGINTLGVGQGDYFTTITQLKNKMAISYSLNNVKIFINGVLVATDTSATIPTMNTFNIGNRTLDNIIGSSYKQAILFKTQLTNAECIALTTL